MADNENLTNANPAIVTLGGRFEIISTMPMPDLNGIGGPAYAARAKGEAVSDLFAVLCTSGLPPRLDMLNTLRGLDHANLIKYIESGVVTWVNGASIYAFIYRRPLAPRMIMTVGEQHPVMSEDAANHYFVTPMIAALAELMRMGIVHNGIRSTNIFWRIGTATPPQLGECASAPAGYGQPVMFETIERALCTPSGRGPGSFTDDCYAFGVTFALLVLGTNPFQGMSDAEIIDVKINKGTFAAMVNNQRLSSSHVEILRGLLTDDARQRWIASDLEQWLSGRRLTPKSTDAGRRAARHLDFAGKQYWQVRPLAIDLAKNITESTKIIENGSLEKWLRRSLGDDDRANNLEDVIAGLKASGKVANYEDQLVTRAAIALDPISPIHYRGISVMPNGIASMMVEAALTGNNTALLSEIIACQFVGAWIDMQREVKSDFVTLGTQLERMKSLVEKTTYGNGLERVLYELNPGIPCLSPMLRDYYVTSAKTMLPTLEIIATQANRPREPMDRHIAAFLIVRDHRSEMLLEAMTAKEGSIRRGVALLTLYSEMQYRYGPTNLPKLAGWLAPVAEPATKRFLSKTTRERVSRQIKEVTERGDLSALLSLIDEPKRLERDQQDFNAARYLYRTTEMEIAQLETKLSNRDAIIQATGKPMAAAISSFLAIILVSAAIIRGILHALMM